MEIKVTSRLNLQYTTTPAIHKEYHMGPSHPTLPPFGAILFPSPLQTAPPIFLLLPCPFRELLVSIQILRICGNKNPVLPYRAWTTDTAYAPVPNHINQ